MVVIDRKRILVADTNLLGLASLIATLKDHYHVAVAGTTTQVIELLDKNAVDLLLLETRLPGADPFALCRELRAAGQSTTLPIIFITSHHSAQEEEHAFEAGASDYIARSASPLSIKARVKNQLRLGAALSELTRLNTLALDANPNTGLPGNNSIHKELERLVTHKDAACVIYADLDHFKAYNDNYGFARGDEMIIFTANVIRVALHVCGCPDAFLGHIGGDDFVFTVPSRQSPAVTAEIIRRIDLGIPEFYSETDAGRGYIVAANREGIEQQHPLASLSMGGVDLSLRPFTTVFAIIDACTETKKLAKQQRGSALYLCQRHASPRA